MIPSDRSISEAIARGRLEIDPFEPALVQPASIDVRLDTLEIGNRANLPIALYPGMRIGQLAFVQMTTAAERPCGLGRGNTYSGQQLPTASRLSLDFK
ncbi:MAG TPA: hypothetical protein VKV73_16335 [Chloroflexota bacterium]|nr:hypothetical protein [Chloroflexota bacterium]